MRATLRDSNSAVVGYWEPRAILKWPSLVSFQGAVFELADQFPLGDVTYRERTPHEIPRSQFSVDEPAASL